MKIPALLAIIVSVLLVASCAAAKKKEIPGSDIAGIRTSVQRILISPLAFDSAFVAVEGIARDVKARTEGEGSKIAFKLSDDRGNFVNVSSPYAWSVAEGDPLIVGGVYRKSANEIEAERMEKIILDEKTN